MKVECIRNFENARASRLYKDEIYPVKGQIYTVRSFRSSTTPGIVDCYLLEEIVNPVRAYMDGTGEPGFDVTCFRPVTDISALTKLSKVRELEDA